VTVDRDVVIEKIANFMVQEAQDTLRVRSVGGEEGPNRVY
jgi:hypothetical protein